jgi:hypothetical protein
VIFASGVIIGVGVMMIINMKPWPGELRTFEERRDRLTERIADKLDFSTEQTEQLRAVIGERLQSIQELRKKLEPEMENEAKALREQIDQIVREDQKEKWRELYESLHKRWFRRSSSKRSPPPSTQPLEP